VTNLKDGKESYVEELMVDTVGGLMSRTIFIGDELRRHQRLVTIGTEFAQDMPDGRATKVRNSTSISQEFSKPFTFRFVVGP